MPIEECAPVEYYNKMFRADANHCRSPAFVERNKALLKLIKSEKFTHIFEFACASGLLAEMFCELHPECHEYFATDFSSEAIGLARRYTTNYSSINALVSDITKTYPNFDWPAYDLVVSTSLEHLPKGCDLDIIKNIEPGTSVLFSLTTFSLPDSASHPHPYPSDTYIYDRFKEHIDIKKLVYYEPLKVFLLYGVKT